MSDVESKVLTAVLRDKQVHVLMQANIERLLSTHTDVWEFIKSYVDKNGSVPPEAIVVENFRDFAPEQSVGSTKHHLGELQAEYLDARARDIVRHAAVDIQDGNPSKAINDIIAEVSDLKKVTTAIRDVDLVDVDAAIAHFETVQKMNAMGSYGIKTGLPGFDAVLPSGITGGMLGVFLAYPGIGKSFLALYFAAQAWKQGKVPLIISLEMSETEVRNRLFTILGEGIWNLRKLGLGEVELDMFRKWHSKVLKDKPPFYIVATDEEEVSPSVVKAKIDQYKPDFVVLDYLQLMSPNAKADGEVSKMKNLSRELKQLARMSEIPILAISSATPDDVTNMSAPPTLGQTAWSRQIAYDADWLVALGRDPNSDIIEGVYRKNRHGPMNVFYLQVDFNSGRFLYVDDPDNVV